VPDPEKTKAALDDPARDYSHRFSDVVVFLEGSGWKKRIKGSHHVFTRTGIPILLNLQPEKNGKAKGYQIRQVRQALNRFK
jgi:predicted RNA binding protein YcfA (HicA-like mRNA interferase family)